MDAGAIAVAVMFEALANEVGGKRLRSLGKPWRVPPTKKFVNDPRQFAPEMLKGIALAHPQTLRYVPEYNLIMRTDDSSL